MFTLRQKIESLRQQLAAGCAIVVEFQKGEAIDEIGVARELYKNLVIVVLKNVYS